MILVVRYIVRVNTTISNANANIQEMTRTGRLVRELSHICSEYERYTLHACHRRSISALINPEIILYTNVLSSVMQNLRFSDCTINIPRMFIAFPYDERREF